MATAENKSYFDCADSRSLTVDGALSVEIRAAEIETALRTLQFAAALVQLFRARRTILPGVRRFRSRPMRALVGARRPLFLVHVRGLDTTVSSAEFHFSARHSQSPRRKKLARYAARSFATCAVRLQQSARINHAPSRRHTFTYFPRSGITVPSALCTTTEKRPSSIAISPE